MKRVMILSLVLFFGPVFVASADSSFQGTWEGVSQSQGGAVVRESMSTVLVVENDQAPYKGYIKNSHPKFREPKVEKFDDGKLDSSGRLVFEIQGGRGKAVFELKSPTELSGTVMIGAGRQDWEIKLTKKK